MLQSKEYKEAFEDGFFNVKKAFNELSKEKKEFHREKIKGIEDPLKDKNGIDEVCFEETYLLSLSILGRFVTAMDPVCEKEYVNINQAKRAGCMAALKNIGDFINSIDLNSDEIREELKLSKEFLMKFYNELLDSMDEDFGLSFTGWKQKNKHAWYLASRERDERYFDEYLKNQKNSGYSYDDVMPFYRKGGQAIDFEESQALIVTRHPALVEFLRQRGITGRVVSHATKEDVKDKVVCGVLPLNLASLAKRVISVDLELPAEKRGCELTLDEVEKYFVGMETYEVRKI